MERFKTRLTELLPIFAAILCCVQPWLDVADYWQTELALSNWPMQILRILLLAITVFLGFVLSRKKWVYAAGAGVLALFLAGHVLACAGAGYLNPLEDLKEQFRSMIAPITAVCFITIFRRNEKVLPTVMKAFVINLGVILAVELAATVTGTDPHTYGNKGIGVLGWFVWPNSQSAILSFLAPVCICWTVRRWEGRLLPVALVTLLSLGSLYLLGTRLAFAAFTAIGFGMAVSLLLIPGHRWKQALVIALCTVLFMGLYPLSPMRANQAAVDQNAKIKQAEIDQIVLAAGIDPAEGRTEDLEVLEQVYAKYLQSMINRFGIRRTAEAYDYSFKVSDIADRRRMQITFCQLQREDSPALSAWFGLEVGRLRQQTLLYSFTQQRWYETVEPLFVDVDVYDVYFQSGIIGLLLLALFLLVILLRSLAALIRAPKRVFGLPFAAIAIACCCGLVHGVFTFSVIRRNNASVYFGIVLGALWVLADAANKNKERLES